MIYKNIGLILLFVSSFFLAQSVEVVETKKLSLDIVDEAFSPRFSSDDSKIIFSSANYKGLYLYDRKSNLSSTISELNGVGYNPLVVDNETIIYRSFNIENGKKFHSVKSYGFSSGKKEVIEENKRSLKLPNQLPTKEIVLVENSVQRKREIINSKLAKSTLITKAVYVENNNLYLVVGEETKLLNPLGEGVYVWESISQDGAKILFTFGNKGAYICDLEGKILDRIENAHYPRFSPNGKYISFMIDEDNGYNYVSSDIFIYSEELKTSLQVTSTNNKIEMFAEWSNDGSQLVYHTQEGEIYISTLQFEN